jgi:pilus assembly protein CpaF
MSSLGDRLSAARKATDDEATPFDPDVQLDATAEQPTTEAEPDATPTYSAKHAGPTAGATPPKPEVPVPTSGGGRRALPTTQQDRMDELKQTVHAELLKQLGP